MQAIGGTARFTRQPGAGRPPRFSRAPGPRLGRDGLNRVQEPRADAIDDGCVPRRGDEHQIARIARLRECRLHAGRQPGFDQHLMKRPRGALAEHVAQHSQRCKIGMRRSGNMVQNSQRRTAALLLNRDHPFSRLRRFDRIRFRQRLFRAGQPAEVLFHQRQAARFLELAGDDQHDIVGPVVSPVEAPELFDRDALDVALIADRGFAVVVPFVSGGRHRRPQPLCGGGPRDLELVAHDGHFGSQVLLADQAVDQPVGFKPDRELEIAVAGGQGFEIARAIDAGRRVEPRPASTERIGNSGMRRRSFEQHVLQQMRQASLAGTFVPRADQHRHVHGDGRFRSVGVQQYPQPVVEPILGDSGDRGDLLCRCRSVVRSEYQQESAAEQQGRPTPRDHNHRVHELLARMDKTDAQP